MLVFSATSLQARLINPGNPRALFFNDRVVLGYVRNGEILEVAAQDATAGIVFYTLEQKAAAAPQFQRVTTCLGCHLNADTLGVPGLLMFSTTPASDVEAGHGRVAMDHRMPLKDRWGGWFVTGSSGGAGHIGNKVPALDGRPNRELASASGLFEPDGFRATTSDIAALMVFSHQTYMTNLITRAGWEARAADPRLHPPFVAAPGEDARVAAVMSGVANEVVDYMLFIDETRLTDRVAGASGFAERFSAAGPRDKKGRSLHELDLNRRLMKYPCSYLIYSPAFDQLPPGARDPIYKRMWQILSGSERAARYRRRCRWRIGARSSKSCATRSRVCLVLQRRREVDPRQIIMAIKLSLEITRQMQASIKRYFAEHLDQDIGDLKAGLVLDYCLKEIGPAVYNRAIADAQAYFQDRVGDLEGVCHEDEFTYWAPAAPRPAADPRRSRRGSAS